MFRDADRFEALFAALWSCRSPFARPRVRLDRGPKVFLSRIVPKVPRLTLNLTLQSWEFNCGTSEHSSDACLSSDWKCFNDFLMMLQFTSLALFIVKSSQASLRGFSLRQRNGSEKRQPRISVVEREWMWHKAISDHLVRAVPAFGFILALAKSSARKMLLISAKTYMSSFQLSSLSWAIFMGDVRELFTRLLAFFSLSNPESTSMSCNAHQSELDFRGSPRITHNLLNELPLEWSRERMGLCTLDRLTWGLGGIILTKVQSLSCRKHPGTAHTCAVRFG